MITVNDNVITLIMKIRVSMKETFMVTKMILSKVIPIMKTIILIMIIVIILVIVMTLRMFSIMIIVIIMMNPIFPTYN